MIRKVSKKKNIQTVLTITLISLIIITAVLMNFFSQSSFRLNIDAIRQIPKLSALPISVIGINETNILNETKLDYNSSSAQLNKNSISSDTSKFNTNNYDGYSVLQLVMMQLYFSSPNTNQGPTIWSNTTFPINVTESISLENSNFTTYTYGGYPVLQPNKTEFNFSFPNNTNQGQLAGSDALTLNTYAVQKIGFDATFIAPKTGALGFDEMAIFATSDIITYKGVEFGIRMDLKDGFVYGYIQEPNGNYGDISFQMVNLMPNDGIIHRYTLIVYSSGVYFFIDGIDHGHLNFPSNNDYSNLTYSILAVVHRFTDYWDSNGDIMIAGNFSLNQQ